MAEVVVDPEAPAGSLATVESGDTVVFQPVTYMLSAVLTLSGLNDLRIEGEGATLLSASGSANPGQCLTLQNCNNFTLTGLRGDGNARVHGGHPGTRHIFRVHGGTDWGVEGLAGVDAVSDVLYIRPTDEEDIDTFPRRFRVRDFRVDSAHRLGLAVIGGFDGHFARLRIKDVRGAAPQCGIDVEANLETVDPGLDRLVFTDVEIVDCIGGIQISNKATPSRLVLEGITTRNTERCSIFFGGQNNRILNLRAVNHVAPPAWQAGEAVEVGERRMGSYEASIRGRLYWECVTAGTTGQTEPTSFEQEADIEDGSVVWRSRGSVRLGALSAPDDENVSGNVVLGYQIDSTGIDAISLPAARVPVQSSALWRPR